MDSSYDPPRVETDGDDEEITVRPPAFDPYRIASPPQPMR